jgi:hypothetical protein
VEIIVADADAELGSSGNGDGSREKRGNGNCGCAKRLYREAKHDYLLMIEMRRPPVRQVAKVHSPLGSKAVTMAFDTPARE